MNILLINHYAGSPYYGMEFRPYYLAREWVKQGHNVIIICASFSHLRQHNPEVDTDFQEESIDGIKYVWLKTPKYNCSFARIMNIMTFVMKLLMNFKKIAKLYKLDLVIASSTYTIDNFPAYKIAKASGAKYTYEIHDLWPLSPMLIGGYSKYHPFIIIMQWGENYAYRHVDKVISLLWNAEEHCKKHGLSSSKFVFIPNGYNQEEWTDEVFHQELPYEHKNKFKELKNKIIVGFSGGFAASGALMTFIEVANVLKDREDIHFVLVGKGPEEDNIRNYAHALSLSNISFLPAIPKKCIPSLIKCFDIAYYGGIHSSLHKYGTSANKMTDYMLSSKPIVQSIDEPRSLIERIGAGIRVPAESPIDSAKAIVKLIDMGNKQMLLLGERGRKYASEHLTWERLSSDFIKGVYE